MKLNVCRRASFLLAFCYLAFILVVFTPLAHAEAPWVKTYDTGNTPTEVFDIGDTVRIKAYSYMTPYRIVVKDTDGVTIFTDISHTESYSRDVTGITTTLGWWTITLWGVYPLHEIRYAVGWYHVIPEVPIGILAVTAACFAGLAFKRIQHRR